MIQSVSAFHVWTAATGSMNSTEGWSPRDGTRLAGILARTHWKSPLPNVPAITGPESVEAGAGTPAGPSHASTVSGYAPGSTTMRTSTRPWVAISGRTFHAASYGPTQFTAGMEDAASRSAGRPRTMKAACGGYRRTPIPRGPRSVFHSPFMGTPKGTTPTAIPPAATDQGGG